MHILTALDIRIQSIPSAMTLEIGKEDFTLGMITDCYVVFCGKAVRVNARYQTRIEIEHKIETLRP